MHKTETGGVELDLRDAASVRKAVERIGLPVLVQPNVSGGVEVLAGVVQDPTFGPLVGFGIGGTLAELVAETAYRLAPLTDVDAADLVTTGKAGRLLAGFRGADPTDTAAVADLLLRLGQLAAAVPEIAELDLNPVIALDEGCVAVDARIRIATPRLSPRAKRW